MARHIEAQTVRTVRTPRTVRRTQIMSNDRVHQRLDLTKQPLFSNQVN